MGLEDRRDVSGNGGEVMCGPEGTARYIRPSIGLSSRHDDGSPFQPLLPTELQGKLGQERTPSHGSSTQRLGSTDVDGADWSGSHYSGLLGRVW
jgi:hypothetical protein